MLKGDTDPWRDVGHAKWYDPYAAFEDPKSNQFHSAVKAEQSFFSAAIRRSKEVAAWKRSFETFYRTSIPMGAEFAEEELPGGVLIQHRPGHRLNVWLSVKCEPDFVGLSDFGINADLGLCFTIADIGKGSQYNELAVYEITNLKQPIWRKAPVGPTAAFCQSSSNLYYTTVEKALRSNGIECVDLRTGGKKHTVYHNDDGRFQVELFAPRAQPDLFVRITNALSQRIGLLTTDDGVKWITTHIPIDADGAGETQVPLTRRAYVTNDALFIDGRPEYRFAPYFLESAAPAFGSDSFLIVTVRNGCPTLILYRSGHAKTLLEMKEPAAITLQTYSVVPTVEVSTSWTAKKVYEVGVDGVLGLKKTFPMPLELKFHIHGLASSIPYTIVATTCKPKKLLVEAYGSYGISASRGYPIHWLPWLQRDYAIAVAMPRGGRENGDAWYDAARTALRKKTTFDDVVCVIKHAQRRLGIGAQRTIIYGRSAGGWMAAYIGLAHPECVGAVYAEVPYLDVLRTTTNPALPLTILEYDEFGNPAKRPAEFAEIRTLSPVDLASSAASGVLRHYPFFLVRTALHDSQVLPYEALKFAARLRSGGWPADRIVVGIDADGGHFAAESAWAEQLGADAALLDTLSLRERVITPTAVGRVTRRNKCGKRTTRKRSK